MIRSSIACRRGLRASTARQVEALITTLDALSVVGLAAVAARGEEGDEVALVLDNSDDERIFRITAIKNRFDESYDDNKSGGYRDLSLSVEVVLPALRLISTGLPGVCFPAPLLHVQSVTTVVVAGGRWGG
jgi:hypothetical protein